jgi:hypothetical protein
LCWRGSPPSPVQQDGFDLRCREPVERDETCRSDEFSARAYVTTYSDRRDGSDFYALSCIHSLYTACRCRSHRRCLYGVAMRETPIYEQLRGERINADVPSSETGPSRLGPPGRHRRVPDTTGSVAACRPPGPGADLVVHQHALPGIGVQPPGGLQRTAALRGPRATVPRPARAGQALARRQQPSNGYRRT